MSTVRSALDELRLEDLHHVGNDALVADLDELERAARIIDFERARRLREVERRETFAVDGYRTVSACLADRHRVAPGTPLAERAPP